MAGGFVLYLRCTLYLFSQRTNTHAFSAHMAHHYVGIGHLALRTAMSFTGICVKWSTS